MIIYWLDTLNFLFALAGLAMLVLTVGLFWDYYFLKSKYYAQWLTPFVWPIIMLTTIGSVAISLLYSEYFGFIPCSLCWLQRIVLYPQALLSVMAFRLKEQVYFPIYGIALSAFGFLVAVYQYLYQMVPQDILERGVMPCLADGSADCGTKVINEFGFVTFPLLSAITFAFLIVLYLNLKRQITQPPLRGGVNKS